MGQEFGEAPALALFDNASFN